jgi:hypothetical protein
MECKNGRGSAVFGVRVDWIADFPPHGPATCRATAALVAHHAAQISFRSDKLHALQTTELNTSARKFDLHPPA